LEVVISNHATRPGPTSAGSDFAEGEPDLPAQIPSGANCAIKCSNVPKTISVLGFKTATSY
jgi:hypothetical protein